MKNHEGKIARVTIINPDGSIILNRRPDWSKQAANKLQIMGGKFEETDNTRKHAAQREVYEELGLIKDIGEFLFVSANENNGWITFAFILLLDEMHDKNQMPNHGEFDSIEFIKAEDIATLTKEGEIAFDHPEILQSILQILLN